MTQSNPLRVGFIGAGGSWGPRAHVPAFDRLEGPSTSTPARVGPVYVQVLSELLP